MSSVLDEYFAEKARRSQHRRFASISEHELQSGAISHAEASR
jgi:hypothetical protein